MAPKLTEDEIDDLIYFARAGENEDLAEMLVSLAEREKMTVAEILIAAKDEGNKSTTLHMATGNGHLGTTPLWSLRSVVDAVQKLCASFSMHLMRGRRRRSRPFLMSPTSMEIPACTGRLWAATWTR